MIINTVVGSFNVRKIDEFGGLDLQDKMLGIQISATYHKSINDFSVNTIKSVAEIDLNNTKEIISKALQEYVDSNEDWEVELICKNASEVMDKIEADLARMRKIVDEEGWEGLKRREKEKETAKGVKSLRPT